MKNRNQRPRLGHFAALTVALAAAMGMNAQAHEHDHSSAHAHSGEAAHVHGVVALDVAVDGHDLVLALHAPLADIVGFEHAPSSDEQRAQAAAAKDKLQAAAEWFKPSAAAQCKLESVSLEAPVLGWDDGHGHEHEHDHDHKEAGKAHTHGHEPDHAKKGEADHEHGHADLEANVQFHCENTKALQQVDVQLFKGFHTINTINVQTAVESKQTKQVLNAQSTVIDLAN